MAKLRVCSLFSGIGGFETGLEEAWGKKNIDVVFASEIDKYASAAYETLYGHKPNGDITKVSEKDIPDHDLLVGGFPCQAFSVSGKRLGFEDTRGTLFFEIVRIAKEKKPKMMILENVKGLVGHDKGRTLDVIIKTLGDIGYKVDFDVLNSKYFGVPQNRERIFIVCHRDAKEEPWDIPKGNGVLLKAKRRVMELEGVKTFNFSFPTHTEVSQNLIDILESEVDEKYFLSKERLSNYVSIKNSSRTDIKKIGYIKKDKEQFRVHDPQGIMPTITANNSGGRSPGGLIAHKKVGLTQLGFIDKNAQGNRVYSVNGVSPTVSSQTGGLGGSGGGVFDVESLLEDAVLREEMEKEIRQIVSKSRPNEEVSVNFKNNGDIRPHRNDSRKSGISELNINYEGNQAFTVTASHAPKIYGQSTQWRVRKLTPLECFRLQGFPDIYYEKLKESGLSDSQLYKMAGNAVTTKVIQDLGCRLLKELKIHK